MRRWRLRRGKVPFIDSEPHPGHFRPSQCKRSLAGNVYCTPTNEFTAGHKTPPGCQAETQPALLVTRPSDAPTSNILRRPLRSGRSTPTLRSNRPGRSSAASSTSCRLVAAMHTTTYSCPPAWEKLGRAGSELARHQTPGQQDSTWHTCRSKYRCGHLMVNGRQPKYLRWCRSSLHWLKF